MTEYLRYSTMWWKVHGPAGKIFKLKESLKKSGGDFNFFFGVWIFSLIVLLSSQILETPNFGHLIHYFRPQHKDIFINIFLIVTLRYFQNIIQCSTCSVVILDLICDKNPSLSGVRYPGFPIEWIFYWIESRQIKIFESIFELNLPGTKVIE